MKKIYSVILLLTFLVGTLQPIMPMIEYQLFEGDLIELLSGDVCFSDEICEMISCLRNVDCPSCDDDQNLLDTNYYPLAIKITSEPPLDGFFIGAVFDLPIVDEVTNPTQLPNPPPPRLS